MDVEEGWFMSFVRFFLPANPTGYICITELGDSAFSKDLVHIWDES